MGQMLSSIADVLRIDAACETERLVAMIKSTVFSRFRRKGAVIGVSGGIDSSVVAFLCARALGSDRVCLLLMPESESSSDSIRLGKMVAEALHAKFTIENISGILHAARCYERRDAAIRLLVPEYADDYRCKIVLPAVAEGSEYAIFSIVVQAPNGATRKIRLTAEAYLGIVAATNFKQRTRKMLEYHYADLLHYAVAGTPNRLEYDQGFFVKNGDGAADFKPIAHLYKSQVYQLAEYLGVPEEIRRQMPTTDTYSLAQSQEEFYFSLPLFAMDLCLYGKNHDILPAEIATVTEMTEEQVRRTYKMIESKRKVAEYLRGQPVLMERVAATDATEV